MTKLVLGQCVNCGYQRELTIPKSTIANKIYAICYSCKKGRYFYVKSPKIIGVCEHCNKSFDLNKDHSC